MKIYFCDNLAESQVEDSLNVIFVATFSFMIFYSFFYDLLVEIVFLWSLWFFGCPKCGNDFYDFLLQSLVILMIFMILMILNFLFIHNVFIRARQSVWDNYYVRCNVSQQSTDTRHMPHENNRIRSHIEYTQSDKV